MERHTLAALILAGAALASGLARAALQRKAKKNRQKPPARPKESDSSSTGY